MNSDQALKRFLEYDFKGVLDIGSGQGNHAQAMSSAGRNVITISLKPPADIVGDYLFTYVNPMEAIWCSHCLEHQRNVGFFLDKIYNDLKPGGVLALTVPPYRELLVGGHLVAWTPATLIYNLILAGFDCSRARVKQYDYNISVILEKMPADLPDLDMDHGDIERLMPFFPIKVQQNSPGLFESNWSLNVQYET